MAERRRQIAESPNGSYLLEPYQLVSQNKLEPLLKEVAEGTPNVTVRYGCELMDFDQNAEGVIACLNLFGGPSSAHAKSPRIVASTSASGFASRRL